MAFLGVLAVVFLLLLICIAALFLAALVIALVVSVLLLGAGATALGAAGAVGSGFVKNVITRNILLIVWLSVLAFGLGCIALVCWWVFDYTVLLLLAGALSAGMFVLGCIGLFYAQRVQRKAARYWLNALFIILLTAGLLAAVTVILVGVFAPVYSDTYLPALINELRSA